MENEKCPYCGMIMTAGRIRGDSRVGLLFNAEGDEHNGWDIAYQRGQVHKAGIGKFKIPAMYCSSCGKLIIDVKVKGY